MNLWAVFLTGLTTGGISCLALQGGLLASAIATKRATDTAAEKRISDDLLPTAMFLGSKLLIHTALGFLLGGIGAFFQLSLGMRLTFQFVTAVFLLATAMNLLEVHPIFRFVAFQPPKFLQRLVRQSSKSESLFAPALLGLFTIFIPCGVTQAMEVVAISSGSPWTGAAIMFAFVLGTMPLFTLIGVATARLSAAWNQRFLQAAAFALIVLAISGINGVLTVLDAPITLGKLGQTLFSFGEPPNWYGSGKAFADSGTAAARNGVQVVKIAITSQGYSPRTVRVRKGIPVQLELNSQDAFSCASSFVFRKFNIAMQLQPTDRKVITFTPTETGKFPFTCSMGMYSGVMEVI